MARDRSNRRCQTACPADILVPELPPTAALAIDVSYGGTFLETSAALPLGLRVTVRLRPEHGPVFEAAGRILRTGHLARRVLHPELEYLWVRAAGLAVKFDSLNVLAIQWMDAYLDSLES